MKRLLSILTLAAPAAHAQCVMCFRTAAAQQMERARILNLGIVIMLVPPVLILAGFLLLAWRRSKTYAEPESAEHSGEGFRMPDFAFRMETANPPKSES